jgi:UDP-2-acetamido-3-amino-2,3-dideoxy-glucuronate N-acetyltransferase
LTPALVPSDRAPGLFIAPGTVIPDDAEIAPHVTIYSGVELGSRILLDQGAIIGRPQRIDARSRTPARVGPEPTVIGEGAWVGSNTVVVASARIGAGVKLSDHVLVREGATVAEDAMIGRGTSVSHGVVIGARTRIQTDTIIGPSTVIEEDVLVSPRVMFLGDPTMGRRPAGPGAPGILVRRASRIGTSAILFPPLEIGEEAVVGAAAMVRADVPPRTVVAGAPARTLRAVRDDELLERWRGSA